jgi:rhodanese-related sulfurtransferase
MIEFIKKILGFGPSVNYKELMENGAVIIDVRTKGEFAGGHIKGSTNIPVNQLAANLGKFKNKENTIITCCASGARSGAAKRLLISSGYTNVYNGGSWYSLRNKI